MHLPTWSDEEVAVYVASRREKRYGEALLRGILTRSTRHAPSVGRLKKAYEDGILFGETHSIRPWGTPSHETVHLVRLTSHGERLVDAHVARTGTRAMKETPAAQLSQEVALGLRASRASTTSAEPDGRGF